MSTTKLAATLAVIAALTIAPSIATAAPPPAPESGVAHAQPWLDWANSVIASTPVKYTMLLPDSVGRTKNEISIETLEFPAVLTADESVATPGYWLPEVNDEVP